MEGYWREGERLENRRVSLAVNNRIWSQWHTARERRYWRQSRLMESPACLPPTPYFCPCSESLLNTRVRLNHALLKTCRWPPSESKLVITVTGLDPHRPISFLISFFPLSHRPLSHKVLLLLAWASGCSCWGFSPGVLCLGCSVPTYVSSIPHFLQDLIQMSSQEGLSWAPNSSGSPHLSLTPFPTSALPTLF